jgi:hypothetical protein
MSHGGRKHGHCAGPRGRRFRSREYTSYQAMCQRCYNPKASGWKYYGGRGIKVHPEWLGDGGFERFLAHLGPRPDGMTLDRPNSNGNYEPGNVQWADKWEQARNKRPVSFADRHRSGKRSHEARMAKHARGALRSFGRILGFNATERLMRLIREDLEERFGPPAPMPVPREMMCVEEAFIAGDFSFTSEYWDDLENLQREWRGHGDWTQITGRVAPGFHLNKTQRARDAARKAA